MTWMNKWAGGYPVVATKARGNRVETIDGATLIDFALGDTGAMAGHSPPATAAALQERYVELGGATMMLPIEDAAWVGQELSRRFGLPLWSFTLSGTDSNRWALRIARLVTGKQKVLAFAYGYHGTVDETFVVMGAGGEAVARPGNVGPPVPLSTTTRVAEFNDLASVERVLKHSDIAAIITEPALTNIGLVLPEPGFLEGLHELANQHGALLILDETHTILAGAGGVTRELGLKPAIITIGKSLGGGIPAGAYGLSQAVADKVAQHSEADFIDVGGVGGTLSGNALSVAVMRATLERVLTEEAFEHMIECAVVFESGVREVINKHQIGWSVNRLGARVEYRFCRPAPRNGTESAAASDSELDDYLHLFMINRGLMMTPFHNMALMSPTTSLADVDLHTRLFDEAVSQII
jgi:glutamate-1-semialdehyde 2,1-aminomutase